MSNVNEATNVIIKDLELWWAKLDPKKPVEPFGEKQWEIQVRFPKKRIKEMEQYGKVKETDTTGVYSINFKKRAELKDGGPAKSVPLVDRTGEAVDPKTLGNGSKGAVKLMLQDWATKDAKGKVIKSGTRVMLIKVQVTDLIEYVPKDSNDFDYDDEAPVADEKIPAKNKKPVKKNDDMDDDIPF
jgi:hypothetical protein